MVNDPYINSTKLFLPLKLYFRVIPSNEHAPTRLTMFELRPTFLRISNSWIRPMRCFSSVLSVKKKKKKKKKQKKSKISVHRKFTKSLLFFLSTGYSTWLTSRKVLLRLIDCTVLEKSVS